MWFSVLTMNKKPGHFPRHSHLTNNHRENVSNTIFFSYEERLTDSWNKAVFMFFCKNVSFQTDKNVFSGLHVKPMYSSLKYSFIYAANMLNKF